MKYHDERSRMLGEDPIPKVINKLAIPAIIGMLINAIYNFVDTLFISWIGDEIAMSAATVGFPVFMLIGAFGLTFGVGGGSYLARLLGERKRKRAEEVVSTSYITTLIVGIILSISGLIFLDMILRLCGASDDNIHLAREYASVLFVGSIFIMGNMTLNNLLRAEGSALMSMIGLLTGAILNILLDPIFIFVLDMGVAGAAIASVIAQAITTLLLLSYYLLKKSNILLHISRFRPDYDMYKEILKIGIPTLIRQLLASFAMGLMNNMAFIYGGTTAQAAIGIDLRIFMMGFYALVGYTQGFLPVAGFNYGAKKYKRLLEAVKVAVKITTVYSLIVCAVYLLLTNPIVAMFKQTDEVSEIAIKGLRFMALSMPVMGFSMTINMLFQAMGKAKEAGVMSLSRQGIMFLPMLVLLPQLFGLEGVLISQPVADYLTFVLTGALSIKTLKTIRKLKDEQEEKIVKPFV